MEKSQVEGIESERINPDISPKLRGIHGEIPSRGN